MKMNEREMENKSGSLTVQPYARLVSLPVGPEHVFYFPEGLPAFEEFKQYLFALIPQYKPFVFLNSIKPTGLSFVCIDPFLIYPEYAPRLSLADQKLLGATEAEDIQLLSIVTVRPDMRETTANLQGPIAINIKNSLCKQILCEGQSYPIRCKVLDALDQNCQNVEDHEAVYCR